MNDRYERIRHALAMGPTPESWEQDGDGDAAYAMFCCRSAAEAAFIAACDPDTIRELLVERDALAAEVERLRTDGASAVRWAPGSAYWSEILKELFGPDARKGIDVLERRWQAALERADKLAAALEEIRSRTCINEAMNPDPFALTAMLGDIHHIADTALAKENDNEQ